MIYICGKFHEKYMNMLQANELMIGDWVQIVEPCKYAGAIGRIKTLIDHKDDENAYFKVFLKSNTIHIGIEDICSEDIRPIHLTTEILEKNGFKPYVPENHLETIYACQDVSKAVADELYALWLCQDSSFYLLLRVDGKDMVRMNVCYVHQLQHALKLCGIEKEIVL